MAGVREQNLWLAQVQEAVLEPDRAIIDPHHHLFSNPSRPYLMEDLWADTGAGHKVLATVFVECLAHYRPDGPEHLRCVGETEWVRALASQSTAPGRSWIGGIVGACDLRRGDRVEEVLSGHIEAGAGLFRGIRHAASWDAFPLIGSGHHKAPPQLYLDGAFREGFAQLAKFDLTFDAWLYHPQIPELTDLARAFPMTRIVIDHFGGPLGIGPYAGHRAEIFQTWRRDISALAACANVSMKLGGMAMPVNGFGWDLAARPATSDELVAAQGDWYKAAIDLFGPKRCMFESNVPVDKRSVSYHVVWNAFKKMAATYTEQEKDDMFRGAAARFYTIVGTQPS